MIVVWLWLSLCFEFMPVISQLRLQPIFCDDLFEQPPRLCHSPYRIESWITPSNLGMTFNYCIYLAHSKGRRLPFSKATHWSQQWTQLSDRPTANFTFFGTNPRKHQHEKSTNMKQLFRFDWDDWNYRLSPPKNPSNENGIDNTICYSGKHHI